MSEQESRTFSREFKLEAVRRIEAGENVSALARELTVKRGILYRWRDAHRLGASRKADLQGRIEASPTLKIRSPSAGAIVAWPIGVFCC